ncbi:YicC family protein [bacterium]|nr:MAG: YicC family protein [bacterium]
MIMKIQSMTGYGRGEDGNIRIETRSSNQRSLDIRINIPSYLYSLEPEIRKIVKEKFHRGRIEIFILKAEEEAARVTINKSLAREYYHALLSLKEELSISEDIGINLLAQQKEIFSTEEQEIDATGFYRALHKALDDLRKMRTDEGQVLADDIFRRLEVLSGSLEAIEEKRAEFNAHARSALIEKLKSILDNAPIEEPRIIQEAAILVERSDITEEIVRIKSHLQHAREILESGGVIGKKIDFLTQELHREVNTIGSKAASSGISILVVEMKHEIEKIREQVQNIQ